MDQRAKIVRSALLCRIYRSLKLEIEGDGTSIPHSDRKKVGNRYGAAPARSADLLITKNCPGSEPSFRSIQRCLISTT